jgi:hypothetical protein
MTKINVAAAAKRAAEYACAAAKSAELAVARIDAGLTDAARAAAVRAVQLAYDARIEAYFAAAAAREREEREK